MPNPRIMNVYTVTDAAKALGKTRVTIRKWIDDGFIPEPVIKDTSRGYDHYSEKELQLVAKVLVAHEKQFDYLHHTHESTIELIWGYIGTYRKTIGKDHA